MVDKIEGSEWKSFIFKMLTTADQELVNEHLRNNYINDSEIDIAFGCSDEEFERFKLRIGVLLKLNLSFGALHQKSGKLAAVFINSRDGKDEDLVFPVPADSTGLNDSEFFYQVCKECDDIIFEKYQASFYGEIGYASVDRDFRGQGLAKEMYRRAVDLFTDLGYSIVISVNSSPITMKICTDLKFTELKRWKFSEAKDKHGNMLLKDSKLDGTITLTALRLRL